VQFLENRKRFHTAWTQSGSRGKGRAKGQGATSLYPDPTGAGRVRTAPIGMHGPRRYAIHTL
jgi:hypothetical protein